MALISKRVSLNNLISENINDAFKDIQIVVANLADINTVAAQINTDGLDPLVYTKVETDALYMPLSGGYTLGAADAKFATILNFGTTGINDDATSLTINIDSLNNVGVGALISGWHADQTAIQIGGSLSVSGLTIPDQSNFDSHNQSAIGENYYVDSIGVMQRIISGGISRHRQKNGAHNFDVAAPATIISASVLTPGVQYFIEVPGDTDFTLVGSGNNSAGTKFTATGPGIGTGTASIVEVTNIVNARIAINNDGTVSIPELSFVDGSNYYDSLNVSDALTEIFTNLASTVSNKGASYIGVRDASSLFVSTTVEGVLTEIIANNISTDLNKGATQIGIHDLANNFATTNVETALAELATRTILGESLETNIVLSGSPETTTQNSTDNSVKIATTAYVTTAVSTITTGIAYANYQKGSIRYVQSNVPTLLLYHLTAPNAGGTYTVGPTGSGANIIASALNALPLSASYVSVNLKFDIFGTTIGSYQASFYGFHNDVFGPSAGDRIGYLRHYAQVASTSVSGAQFHKDIPLNENNVFKIQFSESGTSITTEFLLYLIGFGI